MEFCQTPNPVADKGSATDGNLGADFKSLSFWNCGILESNDQIGEEAKNPEHHDIPLRLTAEEYALGSLFRSRKQ